MAPEPLPYRLSARRGGRFPVRTGCPWNPLEPIMTHRKLDRAALYAVLAAVLALYLWAAVAMA